MSITTTIVSSNPVHGELYLIQRYVTKFVNDLQQVGGFSPSTPVSSTSKTDSHDLPEILLKVALNTIATLQISSGQFLKNIAPWYLQTGRKVSQ